MASTQRVILFSATALSDTNTNGEAVSLPTRARCPIGYLTVANADAATTVACVIQHSPDGVNGWTDYLSFTTTSAGASANQVVLPVAGVGVLNDRILPYARATIVLGGATKLADISVNLYVENYAG